MHPRTPALCRLFALLACLAACLTLTSGCPQADSDGDGIPNAVDNCPNVPNPTRPTRITTGSATPATP